MKYNYKLYLFILIIILILLIINLNIHKVVNYETSYDYNNYQIKETFNKTYNYYYFNINNDKYNYDFVIAHNYTNKRKLISDISEEDINEYHCIKLYIYDEWTNEICSNGNDYYSDYALKNISNDNIETSNYSNVYLYNSYKIKYQAYIWNNYGVTDLNNQKEIKFINNETYNNTLYYQYDNRYLIFPDYDQNKTFNKLYIIDTNNDSVNTMNLKYDISFNSYFLGDIENKIYLVDIDNEKEYAININKNNIEKINKNELGKIYEKELKDIQFSKLLHNKYHFTYNNLFNYELDNNILYMYYYNSDNKIKISNKKIDNIISYYNDTVYYRINDSIYAYNITNGEYKILSSFEWNFSSNNKIFIFNK